MQHIKAPFDLCALFDLSLRGIHPVAISTYIIIVIARDLSRGNLNRLLNFFHIFIVTVSN